MARGRSLESTVTGRVVAGMAVLQRAADHGGTRTGLDDIVGSLRRKNEMLESICDNISDGIIVADAAGQVLFVNSTTLKIFGEWFTEPAVADWSTTYGIFYPDIKTPVPTEQLPVVRALQGEETGEMELFIRNESNREGTYIISRASPIFNGDRTAVVAAMCTFRDITREKEAEDRLESTGSDLRSQTQLLETVFNSMSEGIVVADATGKFLYVNPSAQEIVGMGPVDEPPEEWSHVYGTYYPDRETPIKSEDLPLQRAILKGESVDEEDVFIRNQNRPDGIYIRVSARPLLHDVAGVRGGVIIFRDVTEQVNAQEALARAFAQGRLEIVETILHNIGNAINSVTVGIETVRHTLAADPLARRLRALADALKDRQADWIDYISKDPQGRKALPFVIAIADDFARRNEALAKTVERVERRANHIADIVRTQKAIGGPSMSWKDINLKDALTEAARVLQESLDRRGIPIEIDCEDAPREIRIQESPFHQTIVNLIKNSLEAIDALATSGGLEEAPRIHIRAYVEGDFFLLDVTDNGIGIDMKRHKLIFAAGYTTKESGSGLGLYSSASFVTGSGGQIYPMSDGIGSGTTMRIRLRRSSVTPPLAGH
jgi:PAS domain S-box-containing protein